MNKLSIPKGLLFIVCLAGFFLIARDGRLHWDEPYYLYAGGYLDVEDILRADFQPSGIKGHYSSRIFHVLWIHGIVSMIGLGTAAVAAVMGTYLLALGGFLWLTHRIVEEVLTEIPYASLSVVLVGFSPVFLYMACKTQPEIPALFLATLAVYALVRSMRSRPAIWLSVVSASLCATVFFKNAMVLLYASFVISVLVCNVPPYSRPRLLLHALVSGLGSIVLFMATLSWMGLELPSYLAVGAAVKSMSLPAPLYVLNILTEGGLLFLAVPLAFLSRPRKTAFFFCLWFLGATLPVLIALRYVEPRFLIMNLPALAGLTALSINGIASWGSFRKSKTGRMGITAASLAIGLLAASGYAAQFVMPHEVRWDQLHRVLERLDEQKGDREYAILIPWSYTDFHYLRFAFPSRNVYNVHSPDLAGTKKKYWSADIDRTEQYYGSRLLRTGREVQELEKSAIYLGFRLNHTAQNLQTIAKSLQFDKVAERIENAALIDHLNTSWMWGSPLFTFKPILQEGHYIAFAVHSL